MKLFKHCVLFSTLVSAFTISCQKEKSIPENALAQEGTFTSTINISDPTTTGSLKDELAKEGVNLDYVTIEFFYNEVPANMSDYIQNIENLYPVYSSTKDLSDSSGVITINTFSTVNKYLQYLQSQQVPLNFVQYISLVQTEAVNRGYQLNHDIQIQDSAFNSWIVNKYDSVMPAAMASVGLNFIQAFDDVIPYGPSSLLLRSTPWLVFAWNNRIGCYQNFPIGAGYHMNIFWDKAFYWGKPLGTFLRWSFELVSFAPAFGNGHLNNRVTSYLSF